jgi:alanyl-tRNA synthetase
LLDYEAERLLAGATISDGARIVRRAFTDRDAAELRNLASRIAAAGAAVALLGSGGQRTQLILARSADGPGQMDQLLKQALPLLGEAGGGGSATFAQGGGPAAPAERVDLALARAEKLLLAQRS